MNLGFHSGFKFGDYQCVVQEDTDSSDQISQLQTELKRQPDDIDRLLRLGWLLADNGQTNESQACYQRAEKLCQNKVAENSRNGLYLVDLGAAQGGLNRDAEAEKTFRQAVSVSPNQWQCWTSLGNFLASQSTTSLFPEKLRRQAAPGQVPSAALLSYHPPADTLKKSMAYCQEASECFDRAVSLAPAEPQVYLQRAGDISMSNWLGCFFQYFRDNQAISSQRWLSAYVSDEMIASLQKAADLSPKDYQLIGMAAYFKYSKAVALSPSSPDSSASAAETLPDPIRQVIQRAMTRL
jgi:tetratricopeptide (TPR) repeat protein